MADKAISELIAASSVTPTDMFVLEQSGVAKKLTGQILENWLVSFADGHGGIQSIEKVQTSGLVDTYRITLADATTFDFSVTNGKGITSIEKTQTSGLVDTYKIVYNDGTETTFTVTNGEKGDTGDNAYVWIKYASEKPTSSASSFGDVPDDWIGVYSGTESTAPSDPMQYDWFKIKGEKGDTGDASELQSSAVEYQASTSGTVIPSGIWESSVPSVTPGQYLWTRVTLTFNSGNPVVTYSVSRYGIDGSGAVSSVCGVSPDETGNVDLTLDNVGGSLSIDRISGATYGIGDSEVQSNFVQYLGIASDNGTNFSFSIHLSKNIDSSVSSISVSIGTIQIWSASGLIANDTFSNICQVTSVGKEADNAVRVICSSINSGQQIATLTNGIVGIVLNPITISFS